MLILQRPQAAVLMARTPRRRQGRWGSLLFRQFMFLLCSVDHFVFFFCPRLYELTYFFKFILFLYNYFECACICVCVVHTTTCVYRSQDNFWESAFPSIVWVPEIELRLSGLGQGTFTPLNHHAAPNLFFKKKVSPCYLV